MKIEKSYTGELKRSMEWLAAKSDTVFLGQAVAEPGTSIRSSLVDVDPKRLIELPVCEEMQMGMTVGLAVSGFVPVSVYPRWNFLLLAANQLVLHLDRLHEYSGGEYAPHAIIRTSVGAEFPLNPQAQHVGDFTDPFRMMLKYTDIVRLERADQIFDAYRSAYDRRDGRSTILVELMERHIS